MEKPFSEQESLKLIYEMIHEARQDFRQGGFFYLLWGWAVLLACLLHYAIMAYTAFQHPYLVWPVSMLTAGLITFIKIRQYKSVRKVKSHLVNAVFTLWTGFTIALLTTLLLAFMGKLTMLQAYPLIMVLYGLAIFVSGGMLKFKPLVWGGAACWPIALGAAFVSFENQLLLLALAVIIAYLIPGLFIAESQKNKGVFMFQELNPILHQQLRLRIMSLLISVESARIQFSEGKNRHHPGEPEHTDQEPQKCGLPGG